MASTLEITVTATPARAAVLSLGPALEAPPMTGRESQGEEREREDTVGSPGRS